MQESSYQNKIDFGEILQTITFIKNPNVIVEFGILNGFSLRKFIQNSRSDTQITAYDIFEDFNGNHSERSIISEFENINNLVIDYGNFYEKWKTIADNSIDILHIDIANNGYVYEFVFSHYISKMKPSGLVLLEGGSEERDNVPWMKKYNKPKMIPVIKKYQSKYDIKVLGSFPSMTIIRLQ